MNKNNDLKELANAFETLWNKCNSKARPAFETISVPVGQRVTVEIKFSKPPIADEVDRAAAYLMFIKDLVPIERHEARPLADIFEDILNSDVDVIEVMQGREAP